jgi:hypothetical protein
VKNKFEKCEKKYSYSKSRCLFSGICLQWVKAATKELISDGQLANRYMKAAGPHYEEGLLIAGPKYCYLECCYLMTQNIISLSVPFKIRLQ